MKLAIFGATGDTGRHVATAALERGHEVRAFVRNPDKLEMGHDDLEVIVGDAENAEDVQRCVFGVDAIISALGQAKGSSSRLLTRAGKNILDAMETDDVDRFVSLVGAGVEIPGDESTLGRKFMRGLMKVLARDVLDDAQMHAEDVMATDIDYTLVRPPRLTDGPPAGEWTAEETMKLGPSASLTRADLANFMVTVVEEESFIRSAPMVTN